LDAARVVFLPFAQVDFLLYMPTNECSAVDLIFRPSQLKLGWCLSDVFPCPYIFFKKAFCFRTGPLRRPSKHCRTRMGQSVLLKGCCFHRRSTAVLATPHKSTFDATFEKTECFLRSLPTCSYSSRCMSKISCRLMSVVTTPFRMSRSSSFFPSLETQPFFFFGGMVAAVSGTVSQR